MSSAKKLAIREKRHLIMATENLKRAWDGLDLVAEPFLDPDYLESQLQLAMEQLQMGLDLITNFRESDKEASI